MIRVVSIQVAEVTVVTTYRVRIRVTFHRHFIRLIQVELQQQRKLHLMNIRQHSF